LNKAVRAIHSCDVRQQSAGETRLQGRRILILSNFFSQGYGGTPESVLLLARELTALGIAVDVFCGRGLLVDAQALDVLPAEDDAAVFSAARPKMNAYAAVFVADSWNRRSPLLALKAAWSGIPVTYAAKGCLCRIEFRRLRDVKRVPYFLLVEWLPFMLARRVIFSSLAEQRAYMLPPLLWRRRAALLEEPFRGGAPGTRGPDACGPDTCLTLGFLAEISPRKGLLELIAGFGHYVAQHKDRRLRLRIAGQARRWAGDYLEACRALAERTGTAPLIEWCGAVRGDARKDFYRSLDLFLCPSRFESFGLTPLEALWQGTPVCVAPDVGVLEYLQADVPLLRMASLCEQDVAAAIAAFAKDATSWRGKGRAWAGRHTLVRTNAEIAGDFARILLGRAPP
jgi:glycosyltransferase involved in cell wall biosynthesis